MDMLSNRRHAVKKGWLHKRGGSCFSRWKPKWAVLYDQPTVALYIYDKRDHPHPKYIIRPDTIKVSKMEELGNRSLLENKRDSSFVLFSRSRKFYLSAPSDKDRDEWIVCLRQYSNNSVVQQLLKQPSYEVGMDQIDHEDHHPHVYLMDDAQSVYSAVSYKSFASASSRASMDSRSSRRSRSRSRSRQQAIPVQRSKMSEQSIEWLQRYDFEDVSYNGINVLSAEDAMQILAPEASHPPNVTALSPMDDWDAKYQQLILAIKDDGLVLENNLKLCKLVGDFQELAQVLGKKIIDNYHLKADVEDADTFIYGNIMFHFAADYLDTSALSVEIMEKKAANELRAIRCVNQLRTGVHTALMCLVDYKGFRLIAYATMPLDPQKTLALSISEKHARVDESAARCLNQLGQAMNLKSHTVKAGNTSLEINFSASCEAHLARSNGSFYVLNLCDMLPGDLPETESAKTRSFRRLRSEFVIDYEKQLPVDVDLAKDKASCEILRAANRHLRKDIIPNFVKRLDALEVLPIDSHGLTMELHRNGINVRYLGLVYKLTRFPYIRAICATEMISRAFKSLYREQMRRAILHFRQISAGNIHDELETFTVAVFMSALGGDVKKRSRYWTDTLSAVVKDKFDATLGIDEFLALHQPKLFLSFQYHCGVQFVESAAYDFTQEECLTVDDFVSFNVRCKHPESWVGPDLISQMPEERRLVYSLARQLMISGPHRKFEYSAVTAMRLNALSKYSIIIDKTDMAALYSSLALKLSHESHASYGLIMSTHMECEMLLSTRSQGVEHVSDLLSQFKHIRDVVEYHCGDEHPLLFTIYDKMAFLLSKSQRYQKAYEFLEMSISLSTRVLGKVHTISAGYLTKAGYMLLSLHKIDEAFSMFKEALSLFEQLLPQSEAVAENHYCIAEALLDRGDLQQAKAHCEKAKQLREKICGPSHAKTIDSYQQMGKLLSAPYAEYQGVITSNVQRDLQQSIAYYEKVFKYMKHNKVRGGSRNDESIMLTLIKTVVGLKLRTLPTRHKELVRRLRTTQSMHSEVVAKEVILKLVHLTPSVFMEELFQRLDDKSDQDAVAELDAVLQIVESQQISFS